MIRVVKSKKISRFGYSLPARVALTVFFVMLAVLIFLLFTTRIMFRPPSACR